MLVVIGTILCGASTFCAGQRSLVMGYKLPTARSLSFVVTSRSFTGVSDKSVNLQQCVSVSCQIYCSALYYILGPHSVLFVCTEVVLKTLLKSWTNMILIELWNQHGGYLFWIYFYFFCDLLKKQKQEAYLCVRHCFFQWNQLSDSDFRLTALCQGFWVVELAMLAHLLEKEEARVSDRVFDLDTFAASICEDFF